MAKLKNFLKPKENKYDDGYAKSRIGFICEVVSGTTIANLTGGIFLSGYLNYLGFSQGMNGIIIALPVFTTILQPIGAYFATKSGNIKHNALLSSIIQRIAYSLLYFLPLFFFGVSLTVAVPITFLLATAMSALVAPCTTDWMMQITPPKIRTDFFTIREISLVGISAVIGLIIGLIIDKYVKNGNEGGSYTVLGIVILIFSVIYVGSLVYIKAPPKTESGIETAPKLKKIFTDKRFLYVLLITGIYNFAIQIATPFWNVYSISNLNRSFTYLTIMAVIASVAKVLTLQIWRRNNRGEAWSKLCAICMVSIALNQVLNIFAVKQNAGWFLYIPTLVGVLGYAIIGFGLLNFQYSNIISNHNFIYVSIIAVANGVVSIVATFIGGAVVESMVNSGFKIGAIEVVGQQVLMLISGIILLLNSMLILRLVKSKKVT